MWGTGGNDTCNWTDNDAAAAGYDSNNNKNNNGNHPNDDPYYLVASNNTENPFDDKKASSLFGAANKYKRGLHNHNSEANRGSTNYPYVGKNDSSVTERIESSLGNDGGGNDDTSSSSSGSENNNQAPPEFTRQRSGMKRTSDNRPQSPPAAIGISGDAYDSNSWNPDDPYNYYGGVDTYNNNANYDTNPWAPTSLRHPYYDNINDGGNLSNPFDTKSGDSLFNSAKKVSFEKMEKQNERTRDNSNEDSFSEDGQQNGHDKDSAMSPQKRLDNPHHDSNDNDEETAARQSRNPSSEISRLQLTEIPLHNSAAYYDSNDWNPGTDPYPYDPYNIRLFHTHEETTYGSEYGKEGYNLDNTSKDNTSKDNTSNPFDSRKGSSLFGSSQIHTKAGEASRKSRIKNGQDNDSEDSSAENEQRKNKKEMEASQPQKMFSASQDSSYEKNSNNQSTPEGPYNEKLEFNSLSQKHQRQATPRENYDTNQNRMHENVYVDKSGVVDHKRNLMANSNGRLEDRTEVVKMKRKVFDFNKPIDYIDSVVPTEKNGIGLGIGNHNEISSNSRSPDLETGGRKIRFADDEQGSSAGAKPGSSLSSDDSHPREIGFSRRHVMHPVPEDSVPESGALNFNTIVAHNRLHPSSVPEPVLSSSLETSNFENPSFGSSRKTNGKSNGSDSRRTRFSDEHTSEGIPKSKSIRFWALVLGVVLVLGASAVITIVLVSTGGDGSDKAFDDGASQPEVGLPSDEDVVSSFFENPTQVEWVLQGKVLQILPNTTLDMNFSPLDDFLTAVELSADGSKLVVGTVYGSALVYQWNSISRLWDEETNLEFPLDPFPTESIQLPPSVALSGNGLRMVIGSPSAGRAYTYDYRENKDPAWLRHSQPILESQGRDGTGAGVSLSYDGNVVAVGAPFFDGKLSNCGQTRLFRYNGIAWDLEARVEGRMANDNVGAKARLSANARRMVDASERANTENGFSSGIVWTWQRPVSSSVDNIWKLLGPPLLGPSELDRFGSQIDISANGRVVVISAPGFASGAVFVYEYNFPNNAWEPRGSPIPSQGGSSHGVCISADGNVVTIASRSNVQVFQYQVARTAVSATSSPREWVAVGGSFFNASQLAGDIVACSQDGRIVALGKTSPGDDSTVSVFRAVETL